MTGKYNVLIVDDEENIIRALKRELLELEEFNAIGTTDPLRAQEILMNQKIDITFTDYKMPKITGLEVIGFSNQNSPSTINILMTGQADLDTVIAAINEGHVFYFMLKPWKQSDFVAVLRKAIDFKKQEEEKEKIVANYLIDKEQWIKATMSLQTTNKKTEEAFVSAFKKIMEVKDYDLFLHSSRVSKLAVNFGEYLGLGDKQMHTLKYAGVFHDLGKIVIKDRILFKDSGLTEDEFEEMKKHPSVGAEVLRELESFQEVAQAVEQHHEKSDGSGYPKGISGTAICIEAKIIAISDAYDALTSKRSYKEGFTREKTLEMMITGKAGNFDEDLIIHFVEFLKKIPITG